MSLSKTQIDRLGDRLRKGAASEDDLRMLARYRRSFADVYESVASAVRGKLGLEPTGRPAKSTTSIADKLRRESIRLSQIQDIAGCRVIVENIEEQNSVVEALGGLFERVSVVDRRAKPSHGYRAVHVIVIHDGKAVEIQVRTKLQHLWAELSEKLSDLIDPAVKYGGGSEIVQKVLSNTSEMSALQEALEAQLAEHTSTLTGLPATVQHLEESKQTAVKMQRELDAIRQRIHDHIRNYLDLVVQFEGDKDAVSD